MPARKSFMDYMLLSQFKMLRDLASTQKNGEEDQREYTYGYIFCTSIIKNKP